MTSKTTGKIKFALFIPEDTPIAALNMSKRAFNGLCRIGVMTVGQIIDKWYDLSEIRGLGVSTVQDIRAAVFAYNLDLIWNDDEKMHRFAESLKGWRERATA